MSGISYDVEQWQTWEWRSERRYYCVRLQQNLWGDWCLVCCWGGRYNRLGNCKTYYIEDMADADRQLQQIAKRRERRGYRFLER